MYEFFISEWINNFSPETEIVNSIAPWQQKNKQKICIWKPNCHWEMSINYPVFNIGYLNFQANKKWRKLSIKANVDISLKSIGVVVGN